MLEFYLSYCYNSKLYIVQKCTLQKCVIIRAFLFNIDLFNLSFTHTYFIRANCKEQMNVCNSETNSERPISLFNNSLIMFTEEISEMYK